MLFSLASLKQKKDEMYASGEKLLIIIPHFNIGKTKLAEPPVHHSNIYWAAGKKLKLHKT